MSPYHARIIAESGAAVGFDPRHILAFVLTGHPTTSALSREDWQFEIRLAVKCIQHVGVEHAERCAKNWGI